MLRYPFKIVFHSVPSPSKFSILNCIYLSKGRGSYQVIKDSGTFTVSHNTRTDINHILFLFFPTFEFLFLCPSKYIMQIGK